jgi:hypothetical protein
MFSSKSGDLSKEDAVALHRVELCRRLIDEKTYFSQLKLELDGRDLACWCAIKNKHIACHGLNYLHIFKDRNRNRTYDKTVFDYLLEDLKFVMEGFKHIEQKDVSDFEWMLFKIGVEEARLDVSTTFMLFKERETTPYLRCVWLATFVIDLELALADPDMQMRLYRLDRVIWNAFRFACRPTSKEGEPSLPSTKVRKPKKDKT